RHLVQRRSQNVVLKIDVEGHEAQVLRGGSLLLRELRCPVIFESIEIEGSAYPNARLAKQILLEHGYRLFLIRVNVLVPQDAQSIQYGHVADYLALADEAVSTLDKMLSDREVRDLSDAEKLIWIQEMCECPMVYHRRHAIGVLRRFHGEGIARADQIARLTTK